MIEHLGKLVDIIKQIQSGDAEANAVAKDIRQSLPPQFQALIKNSTPESLIAMLEPMVGSFVGQDAVVFLKSETSVKFLGEVLVVLQADEKSS
tara:strand:- start:38 stop:316 length:279 start_codon:yes stop_codon:yes gene_type:complete